MNPLELLSIGSPVRSTNGEDGPLVDLDGVRYYRVQSSDTLAPFLMSLVSDSDHWLFISSNGALTAGRRDPDHALFPYYPDDRIHDSQDQTGSKTILKVAGTAGDVLWEPFAPHGGERHHLQRNLYKAVYGNRILFEEVREDLGLVFRYKWMPSERFGFVRRATLINRGTACLSIELLDGLRNLLPWGLERRFQLEYSTLADGYKRTERVPETDLALYRLSSIPVDRAEPSEALRVNVAWTLGLEPSRILLSSAQVDAFRKGLPLQEESDVRGQRGAFLLNARLGLDPGARRDWLVVGELGLDAAAVRALRKRLAAPAGLEAEVLDDVLRGTRNLVRIVASADGLQRTGDELSTARHFSNSLFNLMRGGVPEDGHQVSVPDFRRFLLASNRDLAARAHTLLGPLPDSIDHGILLERASASGDPDLDRLAHEYLPFGFSRRHGDPSRPWNIFSIQVKDPQGRRILNYEGNWRDIFQNWEALGHAFPGYLEGMIFKFLDASTMDGFNPYRVMREGFEWEVVDPEDSWSYIGYWGDHQVVYLLRLLEASRRFHPDALGKLLGRRVFTFADVPYRLKSYREMLADPHNTITFDEEAHRSTMARMRALGTDGLLRQGPDGPCRANLAEKLLIVALSKLAGFIPEAGIWMNTQRPEWNDGNNALVGFGVSVVTLCHLRRYLDFCRDFFAASGQGQFEVAQEIADLLEAVSAVLEAYLPKAAEAVTDRQRRAVMDGLGRAATAYREGVYTIGFRGDRAQLQATRVQAFLASVIGHLDRSIAANRRPDGLYHAYNLMQLKDGETGIRHLHEMLEGQVAVLGSGLLSTEASADLLDALRRSRLFRADQASYLLSPDLRLPSFLEKNNISREEALASPLLKALHEAGDERILVQDVDGGFHFHADFRNVRHLQNVLQELRGTSLEPLVEQEGGRVLDLYEKVFDHQSFTGRSGAFYKYEGLGCIYWHMVSKLLLAVDETRQRACPEDPGLGRLEAHYRAIREGIGVHKPPEVHGAIPIDPYSHTPGFAGAQQPGMTGQVKEDLLSRLGEMGVHIESGRISFRPWMVRRADFLQEPARFVCVGVDGTSQDLDLEPGSLGFTLCQVPVLLHRDGSPQVRILARDGTWRDRAGLDLSPADSAKVFNRTGDLARIEVFLGLGRTIGSETE